MWNKFDLFVFTSTVLEHMTIMSLSNVNVNVNMGRDSQVDPADIVTQDETGEHCS